jgi:hypothetical protein
MPKKEVPGQATEPISAREEAQLMLGQIHGVIWAAIEDVGIWGKPTPGETDGPGFNEDDDFRRAGDEIHVKFGLVQAALNAMEKDDNLVEHGFGGAQGSVKRKGFWSAIKAFFSRRKESSVSDVPRLRKCLRWCGTILGSLGAALKKEVEKIHGAAAAIEAIKEFTEVILNATEPPEKEQ